MSRGWCSSSAGCVTASTSAAPTTTFPRPVSPHDPARDVCRDHLRAGHDGHGGYAPRFLSQPAGSDARDAEYEALRSGELPDDRDHQFAGYRVDKAALVIGIFPGAGHAFFRGWLTKLATAIFIKALYSLVIAVVVAVSAALAASTAELGFLLAFGLQPVFYWAIFLYREQISARLVAATTGAAGNERLPRMTVVQRGAEIAARPVSAMAGDAAAHGIHARRKQQSALAGGDHLDGPGPREDSHPGNEPADGRPDTGEPSRNGGALRPVPGDPLRANGARPAPGAVLAGVGAASSAAAPAREPSAGAATDGTRHAARPRTARLPRTVSRRRYRRSGRCPVSPRERGTAGRLGSRRGRSVRARRMRT
jgi:hypothetical protein